MSASIIQSLWIGDRLSAMEQLSIASFLRNGHPYHLYVYRQPEGVPDGVGLEDANRIIPEREVFVHRTGSYAIFADWFRWELLHRHGNFWADTDVVCLKPFRFADETVFGLQSPQQVAVGVLKFPAGHQLCGLMRDICASPHQPLPYDTFKERGVKLVRRLFKGNRRSNVGWGEAGGPHGFTRALRHFGMFGEAKPCDWFYPIYYPDWKSAFDETFSDYRHQLAGSYAVHLWQNETRKIPDFDKDARFPEESLYMQLQRRYLG